MSRLSYDGEWGDEHTQYLWEAWKRAVTTSKASIKR